MNRDLLFRYDLNRSILRTLLIYNFNLHCEWLLFNLRQLLFRIINITFDNNSRWINGRDSLIIFPIKQRLTIFRVIFNHVGLR